MSEKLTVGALREAMRVVYSSCRPDLHWSCFREDAIAQDVALGRGWLILNPEHDKLACYEGFLAINAEQEHRVVLSSLLVGSVDDDGAPLVGFWLARPPGLRARTPPLLADPPSAGRGARRLTRFSASWPGGTAYPRVVGPGELAKGLRAALRMTGSADPDCVDCGGSGFLNYHDLFCLCCVMPESNSEDGFTWLSFSDSSRPSGEQFVGVVIVRSVNFLGAIVRAHALGLNPGGEVAGYPMPRSVPDEFVERLLSQEQLEELERRWRAN